MSRQQTLRDHGTAADAVPALAKVLQALQNIPHGKGYQLDGHVALFKEGKLADLNIDVGIIRRARIEQARQLVQLGACPSLHAVALMTRSIPFEMVTTANTVFARSEVPIPPQTRSYYEAILDTIPREQQAMLLPHLESMPAVCIPAAIVKQRLDPTLALVVGKLGFKEPGGQSVYDWEYGVSGPRWI